MKISSFAILVISLVCLGARLDPADVRLRPAPHKPGDIVMDTDWEILPRTDLYEVVPSKLHRARKLPEHGFLELTVPNATGCTGHYFRCPEGKRPFLIRAVFSNESYGRFRIERHGNSLAVVWGTMPPAGLRQELQQSALVVNLDFMPDEIYNEFSSVL